MDYTKIIDINDPVYTFIEVLNHVDLKQYFVEKDYIAGCICRNINRNDTDLDPHLAGPRTALCRVKTAPVE